MAAIVATLFARVYLLGTLGLIVLGYALTAPWTGTPLGRAVVEAVVLWLTVALPPLIVLELLAWCCTRVAARLTARRWSPASAFQHPGAGRRGALW